MQLLRQQLLMSGAEEQPAEHALRRQGQSQKHVWPCSPLVRALRGVVLGLVLRRIALLLSSCASKVAALRRTFSLIKGASWPDNVETYTQSCVQCAACFCH